jgi:hypothetical protein
MAAGLASYRPALARADPALDRREQFVDRFRRHGRERRIEDWQIDGRGRRLRWRRGLAAQRGACTPAVELEIVGAGVAGILVGSANRCARGGRADRAPERSQPKPRERSVVAPAEGFLEQGMPPPQTRGTVELTVQL